MVKETVSFSKIVYYVNVFNSNYTGIYTNYISGNSLSNIDILVFETFIKLFCDYVNKHNFTTEKVEYCTTSIAEITEIMFFLKRLNVIDCLNLETQVEELKKCIKKLFLVISTENNVKWTLGSVDDIIAEETAEEDLEEEYEKTLSRNFLNSCEIKGDVVDIPLDVVDIPLDVVDIPLDVVEETVEDSHDERGGNTECKCNEEKICLECKDEDDEYSEFVNNGLVKEEKDILVTELKSFREDWKKELERKKV